MKRVVAISDMHCGHVVGLTPPDYCKPKTRDLIMAAQKAGWCRPVRVQRVGIDGVPRMVQGYVFELPGKSSE